MLISSARICTLLAAATLFLAPTHGHSADISIETSADQPLEATLVLSSTTLETMTEIPFRLEIRGFEGNEKAAIHSGVCSLTMPAMKMPENHPDLVCQDKICTGTAIFTMAGKWQANFGLILKDGHHASIDFDIDMVRMK